MSEKEGLTRIRLDGEDYAKLQKIAKKRGLTVQQLVDKILEDFSKSKFMKSL
ncbi:MAG: hypothetical protein NWE91_01200 [Candidatus Bathyarchaeota archaeon]|nr:hypothetical protein [Candidatus Bathyarchaeota archaeon]